MSLKILLSSLFLYFIGLTNSFAKDDLTISDLLKKGYKIVAAVAESETRYRTIVFLQRRQSAYLCITQNTSSRCFSLDDH